MRNYRDTSQALPVLIPCTPNKMQGFASFKPGLGGLKPVRTIGDDALDLFVNKGYAFQKEYGRVPGGEISYLMALLHLTEAVKTSDRRPLEWACGRLANDPDPKLRQLDVSEIKARPHQILSEKVTAGAGRVQLVLWYEKRRRGTTFLPGIYCPDVLSALYALTLLRIVGGRGLAVCEICGKAFIRKRRTRRTCSDKCRQVKFRSN